MVPEQITHEVVIDAPIERVWTILTEAEHIREWFAFDGADIDLRPGGKLVMRWQEHGTFLSTIERVEPPYHFSFRGSYLPDTEPDATNSTLVEFTLSPAGDGTRVRVVESGFRELDMPAARQAEFAEGNVQGWTGAFTKLDQYVQRVAA